MRRAAVGKRALALLPLLASACNPPAAPVGEARASFVLLDEAGAPAGQARISSLGAGLLSERVRLDAGLEQRVLLGDDGIELITVAGQSWRQASLTSLTGSWRHRTRAGVAVESARLERGARDLLGVGASLAAPTLGASLSSWWRHAPRLLAGDGAVSVRFLDVASGSALPMRIEPRGALVVERDGRRLPARRWFAFTAASGVGLVTDEAGALLAVEGLSGGHRALLAGTDVPPPPRPPLPAGVREARWLLEDAFGAFDVALTLPARAAGPLPGVLLLPGSGPVDVDGNVPGLALDMYRRLAGALSAQGLAVLRYDKPGIDEVNGERPAVPSADELLRRAQAALRALRERPEVDGRCLFLVGHSEGGMLAPELALRERDSVRGLVLLASPARELFAVLEDQLLAFLRASGASEREIETARSRQEAQLKLLRSGRDVELAQSAAAASSNAWLKSHLDRSPAEALAKLDLPVLAVFGADDLQVLDETEAAPMERALAHLPDADVVVVAGMDHLLMPAGPFPGPGVYGDPGRSHSRFLVEDVPRWLSAHACP